MQQPVVTLVLKTVFTLSNKTSVYKTLTVVFP